LRASLLVRIGAGGAGAVAVLALAWWFLPRPQQGSRAATPSPAAGQPPPVKATPAGPVTFVGDSLTAQGNWQAAFPERTVFNQGVSGDTTLHLMARLPAIRQTGASTYLVMVGINDIVWGFEPNGIASRIQWLRAGLQLGTGARVIIQSTISCERWRCGADGLRRVQELNRLLEQQTPREDYLDLNAVMADRDGLKHPYSLDGVHLTPAGYARWQQRLREQGLL
jgi:lysophospholipase L1-like esterase